GLRQAAQRGLQQNAALRPHQGAGMQLRRQLHRSEGDLQSQRADPVNITPESTKTGKVSSPTVNISAHVLMAPWAAFLCVPKNYLSPTWAVPTLGWSKLPGSAARSGSVTRIVSRTPWRTRTASLARSWDSMPPRWS
ncbi:cellular communication network factor 1, partial [Homo sapiens]